MTERRQNERESGATPPLRGGSGRLLAVLTVVIVVPAAYGFLSKLIDFIYTFRTDAEGRFTIIPIMNYLLVTAGMACLLVWATFGGMFRDVEGPKYTMLERERRLDEQDRRAGVPIDD
ncbi:MAG: hypothetical protein D6788_09705 [Planctomycetota bacterium]|nr:MAG: hypothetical protein D6788_09705 [Planctomycetota bacterium]